LDPFNPEFWAGLAMMGYGGVFAASLLGSLIPFFSGPYIPPIILGVVAGGLDPLPTALLGAAGAATGKLALFHVFRGGRRLLDDGTLSRLEPLERLIKRYGWVVVLLTAATPIPDDVVYLLLALGGYSGLLFFPLVFAGKLLITSAVAYGSLAWLSIACLVLECVQGSPGIGSSLILGAIAAVAAMALAYLLTRVDWQRMLANTGVGG